MRNSQIEPEATTIETLTDSTTIFMDWNEAFSLNVKREWACELPMANLPNQNEVLAQMREQKRMYQNLMAQFVIGNAENLKTTVKKLPSSEVEQGVSAAFLCFVEQLVEAGYSTGQYSAEELDSQVITKLMLFNENGSNTPFFKALIKQTLKRIKKGGK